MKPVQHKPDRAPPMERWVFVAMIGTGGIVFGLGLGALISSQWLPATAGIATGFFATIYVRWRLDESGWP